MKAKLKTETLGKDDPSVVLCKGHVDAKTFNRAFKNEGWSSPGDYLQKDLKYIYAKRRKNGWSCGLSPKTKGVVKATICAWD